MNIARQLLTDIFAHKNGIADTKTLKSAGLTSYYIKQFEEIGVIERVKWGVYRYIGEEIPQVHELVEVASIVKKGVVCLLSAASYYELSTVTPYSYHIAIDRNHNKPVLPDYPPISIYYFSTPMYLEGISFEIIDSTSIKIYSMEKTICDLVRYRKKLGNDVMLECIKNYMASPKRNIPKLMECAKKLKVQNLIKQYIEVLI